MKLMVILFVISLTSFAVQGNPIKSILSAFKDAPMKEQFKVFHHIFEKPYEINSEEGLTRYKIFKENVKKIHEVNAKNLSYKAGINQFTDLTREEFKKKYLMDPQKLRKNIDDTIRSLREEGYFDTHSDDDDETPTVKESIDHRQFLGPVRAQGNCGSCWAFATTSLVEGHLGIKARKVVPFLSAQQLIDCDSNNQGCDGGYYRAAINYIRRYGIVKDSQYPYIDGQNTCTVNIGSDAVKINTVSFCSSMPGYTCTFEKIYSQLMKGPTAVTIDGNGIEFYESGVFVEGECTCTEQNHFVLLAGYGIGDNQEYWIIRNSWGDTWGESGYIKVGRDGNNSSCLVERESWTITLF